MGLFRSLGIGLFILALPVALIATNIRFAASEPRVYDYSVRQYGAASAASIPEAELLRANRGLVRYLTADDVGPLRIEVRDSRGRTESLFNARETAHMADVRALFQALFKVQVIALAVALSLAVLMLVWWPVRALAAAALFGSLLTMGVIGLAGAVAMTGFDSAWSQFHFLAFSNDFWRLDPNTDHLIQMFPEPFWRDITTLIGAFTLLEALLIGGLAFAYLIATKPHGEPKVVPEPRPRLPRPPVAQPPPRIPPPQPRHYIH
ncbi:MAG TPA: TIGR01906 family membrane protein [Dehalococcoidia bacterium]|nr:TIGR01906 family membrane protein [Dehalococcoidia bacterium]